MSRLYQSKRIEPLLEKMDFSRLGNNVALKVHFGEDGCTTYMEPAIVKKVYDKLVSEGKSAKLVETNVLYKGSRTNATDHLSTAKKHGFDFADIEILDGEKGDNFIEVPVKDGGISSAKLGTGIKNYDSMVVVSHFKGHIAAGYGGVFKQLGMGFGSRAGKLHMHAGISPSIDKESCTGCKECIKGCDFDAISLDSEGKAEIDTGRCTGCAMCIAVCPVSAVRIPWGASGNEGLQKNIVDYASAVFQVIPQDRCIFINIIENVTKDCDCVGKSQQPLMEDVGIMMGHDPVSLDKACLDIVEERSPGVLNRINDIDKSVQTVYAEKKGLGSLDYEIEEIDG